MSLRINKFEQIEILYKKIIKSITDPQDYFSLDEYYTLKQLASAVFDKMESKCGIFLGIVRGTNKGSEIGHPGIERALCFPSRFLNEPSTIALPDALRVAIDDIIENTFFLGLICHLFLWRFPTRGDTILIDINTLIYKWTSNALVADNMMKTYNKDLNELPRRVFESFFNSEIEPLLKEQFKLGFWKIGKCRSFFRNLFFSGALLGMQFDLMTKDK